MKLLLLCLFLASPLSIFASEPLAVSHAGKLDFALRDDNAAVPIVLEANAPEPLKRAVEDFANDVEQVIGMRPAILTSPSQGTACIVVGQVGANKAIQSLASEKKLTTDQLAGAWESFIIQTVEKPFPHTDRALVVAGSDVRGTIYGLYTLSEAIGVSPWHWWADVPVARQPDIAIHAVTAHREGPPSVKYRGIFINDEDWGLQPWAANTFEPENGGIGPKTYSRIFELMLRLKANTVWPAMHACTKPFNENPENRLTADRYGIVMGSSHAEPMLRNNVREWTADPATFNYATNRDGVLKYWDERVKENGRFENIYTIGMRGIHDSRMQGGGSPDEQVKLLEQIFTDQRGLLARYVNPEVKQVPQIFCPYKEVLDLYRRGLKVPDDVTIVFPDDNFGYIRTFPADTERQRPGGSGIYYHLSYLGKPLSYLWLDTMPPALIWQQMNAAYEQGARQLWVVNVGDLKPMERGTEFFLRMGWDMKKWSQPESARTFLLEWATREFGSGPAAEIARIEEEYYRLNFQRKPEHLQWWESGKARLPSPFSNAEIDDRLAAFSRIRNSVEALEAKIPAASRAAFFQLVTYPVRASALANERFFWGERFLAAAEPKDDAARQAAARTRDADAALKKDTFFYNETLSNGKWRGILNQDPASREWRSMRIDPAFIPKESDAGGVKIANIKYPSDSPTLPHDWAFEERDGIVSIAAGHSTTASANSEVHWAPVPGLGRTGAAVTLLPTTFESKGTSAPRLDYRVKFTTSGDFNLIAQILPTLPLHEGGSLRFSVSLDDGVPITLVRKREDGNRAWEQGVLDNSANITTTLHVSNPGEHTLHLIGIEPGVVVDKLILSHAPLPAGYLGPAETSVR